MRRKVDSKEIDLSFFIVFSHVSKLVTRHGLHSKLPNRVTRCDVAEKHFFVDF